MAKGLPHPSGFQEFLGIDLVGFADADPGAPAVLAVEHENQTHLAGRVLHRTWKLVSIKAEYRVLVTYFGKGAGREAKTFQDVLFNSVFPATTRDLGHLLVIAGEWGVQPEPNWDRVFSSKLVLGEP